MRIIVTTSPRCGSSSDPFLPSFCSSPTTSLRLSSQKASGSRRWFQAPVSGATVEPRAIVTLPGGSPGPPAGPALSAMEGWPLEDEGPRPIVTFFQPRVSQVLVLQGLFSGSEIAARRFLPKSHLSTVIIRDNTSVQRVQDIKLRHIEDSQKKVGGFFDQMKKKFVHDQQTKMTRWKKQYGHYQRMLEQIDQRAQRRLTISNIIVVEQKRSSLSGWNPTLKPERPKQRLK
ncbi:uncharacterized protein C5orf52 homolog [Hemicordylus capensis]|uniref:uncharacterized protein C5orf52 homolog n=1 Tax=Hemicordylus capensis TaxID=884348 RepID=UPI0023033CB4|nr:uncharacterized protein C5orf52 homolog [Hemicordylus capensis]